MNDIIHAAHERPGASASAPHQHECWELCLCLTGEGCCRFADDELLCHPGDLVVIPADTVHHLTGAEFLVLHVSQAALTFRQPHLTQDDENQSVRHLMEDVLWHFHRAEESRAPLLSAYGHLLVQHVHLRRPSAPQTQLVEDIARNIQQNYTNPLYDLDEPLRSAPYCYDYLCRLFRQELHTTPHKYLTDLRLQSAADALRANPGSSISEIARLCGYSDPLYFSRMFKKKYGASPREYAKGK